MERSQKDFPGRAFAPGSPNIGIGIPDSRRWRLSRALSGPLPGRAQAYTPLTHPAESAPGYVKATAAESGFGPTAAVFST
jgi:hypothetical protein